MAVDAVPAPQIVDRRSVPANYHGTGAITEVPPLNNASGGTGKSRAPAGLHPGEPAASPDGKLIVVGYRDWEDSPGHLRNGISIGAGPNTEMNRSLAIAPDGSWYVLGDDYGMQVYLESYDCTPELFKQAHESSCQTLKQLLEGKRVREQS